ncbi:DUF4255 domain-containing protein [Undibacterium sp. SXout7W]|uniref:DUF4255 domain-containing protein n=1 Tax=Undibacterium sp. SXout7W TaxID=3413049 RepID=UPI003BF2AB90
MDTALNFILTELNSYFSASSSVQESAVVLSGLANPDGSVPLAINNKIVLTLVNIEKETAMGTTGFIPRMGAGFGRSNPTLYLNVYVLVSASFTNYSTGLRRLNQSIGFFQSKPSFTAQNSVAFPAGFELLTMELVSLSMAELSTLWAVLGANYLPSAVYKLRMATVQNEWITEPVPAITQAASNLGS